MNEPEIDLTMKFGLLVSEGPYTHQASDSAYQFALAVLAKGHEIQRVFFYHDGVNNATRLTEPPQDDRHVVNRWSALATEHKVDLVVCVAAALRRGIKEEVLAVSYTHLDVYKRQQLHQPILPTI